MRPTYSHRCSMSAGSGMSSSGPALCIRGPPGVACGSLRAAALAAPDAPASGEDQDERSECMAGRFLWKTLPMRVPRGMTPTSSRRSLRSQGACGHSSPVDKCIRRMPDQWACRNDITTERSPRSIVGGPRRATTDGSGSCRRRARRRPSSRSALCPVRRCSRPPRATLR